MSQILRNTSSIKKFLQKNQSYILNARNFSKNIRTSPVLRNVGILLGKNKNVLSQMTKVAFHPGASNLVPLGKVSEAKSLSGWEIVRHLLRYVFSDNC
uniref:Uncharacterized protein n=1 Tax=Strongyloides stercoralis TaxID=6248 RepID=A0A0K0DVY4_STRER